MKYVRCKAFASPGRCRRKAAWRRAYCPAHQQARDEAARTQAALLDNAIELVCVMDEPKPGRPLTADEARVMRWLANINEKHQSALVRCGSRGGVDSDAEVRDALFL